MAINPVSNLSVHSNGLVDKTIAGKTEKLSGSTLQNNPVTESDQVKLTRRAMRLHKIETYLHKIEPQDVGEASIGRQEESRQEKINAIKEKIAKGEYQIDSLQVAHKMVDFEMQPFA